MNAQKIISMAASQIGVKENPANSNNVKYNTEYYGREVRGSDYPWCCAFVWWVFKACGASKLFYGGKKTAYCPAVENYYKQQGKWFESGKPGDMVLFDFAVKGIAGHIGIIEKVNSDGSYTTIEGNTCLGNDTNGGAVMRRIRYKSSIRGFARPDYDNEEELTMSQYTELKSMIEELSKKITDQMFYNYVDANMPDYAKPTIKKLVDKGYLQGGSNGELHLTDEMLRIFVILDRSGVFDK